MESCASWPRRRVSAAPMRRPAVARGVRFGYSPRVLGAILLAACILLASPALAQVALEEGLAAYRSGNYAKAMEVWRPLADSGNADAQYRIGSMYAEGKGVQRNDATALTWFQRAAEHGNAAAQYNVGASYAAG